MPKANKNKHTDRGGKKEPIDPKMKRIMVLRNGKVKMVYAYEVENDMTDR